MRRFAFALVIVAPLALSVAYADTYQSGSFRSLDPVLNSFGGTSGSASFSSFVSGDQTAGGESASTNFILRSGYLYFDSFFPKSRNWRWWGDESSETPTTALAGENVAPSAVAESDAVKLRITLDETNGIGLVGAKFRLEFATSSTFEAGVRRVVEAAECTGTSIWCYANGGGADGGVISTALLSDADACSGGTGAGCGTHNESGTTTSSFSHAAGAAVEYEFTIVGSGFAKNTTYFFRLFDVVASTSVPLGDAENYPSLATEGATLSFTIDGLPSATVTGGVTTDIDTTATGVPFGGLVASSDLTAAQRLTVTTNAASGYVLYAFSVQDFVSGTGDEISPVSGTNESPSGWGDGCASEAPGCWGYHTTDAVLSGGGGVSTRFAADDTFAGFEGAPGEIAFHGSPVSSDETDIVYRVSARSAQEAGSYETGIVYVVVPTFTF